MYIIRRTISYSASRVNCSPVRKTILGTMEVTKSIAMSISLRIAHRDLSMRRSDVTPGMIP
jgi:hypothetical protein